MGPNDYEIYPFGKDLDRSGLAYDFNVDGSNPKDEDLCDIDEWLSYLEYVHISLTPHKWSADGNTRIKTEIQICIDVFENGSTACQASLGELLERTFDLYDEKPEEELEALEKLQCVITRLISVRRFRMSPE